MLTFAKDFFLLGKCSAAYHSLIAELRKVFIPKKRYVSIVSVQVCLIRIGLLRDNFILLN